MGGRCSASQPAVYLLDALRFSHHENSEDRLLETRARFFATFNFFLHVSVFAQIKLYAPRLQFGVCSIKNIMGEVALSLNELSVVELCAGLAAKKFSAVELAESLTQYIQQNSDLGSIATFDQNHISSRLERLMSVGKPAAPKPRRCTAHSERQY